MADESRWTDEDRDFDRYRPDPRGFARGYATPYGGPYGYAERDRYESGYGRDYGEPYRGYGRSGTHEDPRGVARSGRYGRGWWDRTSDEVSSWFGDEDAEQRRQRDAFERGHRGRGPKGYVRSDERIREDVCDHLSDDRLVDASEIEVAVSGSEVTLSGTVTSRQERRRAEDCAERVSGVTHVQNNLRVAQDSSAPKAGAQPSGPAESRRH